MWYLPLPQREIERFSAPTDQDSNNSVHRVLYKRILEEAIATQITQKQREAMELIYGQGLSIAKAAEHLGIGASAVSCRLNNARGRIKRFAESCLRCIPKPMED